MWDLQHFCNILPRLVRRGSTIPRATFTSFVAHGFENNYRLNSASIFYNDSFSVRELKLLLAVESTWTINTHHDGYRDSLSQLRTSFYSIVMRRKALRFKDFIKLVWMLLGWRSPVNMLSIIRMKRCPLFCPIVISITDTDIVMQWVYCDRYEWNLTASAYRWGNACWKTSLLMLECNVTLAGSMYVLLCTTLVWN